MKIFIDTVIFIDILKDEFPDTQKKFYRAFEKKETLTTSVINIAELMPQFGGNQKELLAFINDHHIQIVNVDLGSTLVASERWINYLGRKKKKVCPHCKSFIPGRENILPDFLIGAIALTHCNRLLTRDHGIYKTYFKDLKNY